MEHRARVGNLLLAALPQADLQLLVRHFRMVQLERDAVLLRSGDPVDRIYFPLSGLIAFIMDMPNGQTVATAIVGNEGAVGVLSTLGPVRSPMTAVVRVAGLALQIVPTRFQAILGSSNALNGAVQTHARALMAQFQHVAACNALHSVEARLARWLLHVHDRVEGNVLPLTQETLAEFLGVRRTTVTQVMSKLREQGAIRSNRRSLIEIDRPRLEAAACECYHLMQERIGQIVLPEEMKEAPVEKPHAQPSLFAKADEKADETHQRSRTPRAVGPRARHHSRHH
jgi:CRP-like cAMP-binding protein